MLYVVGLGLGSESDISVAALDAVRKCDTVFLDVYTSELPGVSVERLEALYGRSVVLGHRDVVESDDDIVLSRAADNDVAFLVVGDPFSATTHTDLVLRAQSRGIAVRVFHNASIMNAAGCTGLQLYNFGRTVSIVFFDDTCDDDGAHSGSVATRAECVAMQNLPTSWYDKICANQRDGLHTLCLLDIKTREQSLENMMRGVPVYLPPRYMSVAQSLRQIQRVERAIRVMRPDYVSVVPLAIGLARVGSENQVIRAGTLHELCVSDFGAPLHSLIVPAALHDHEREFLRQYAVDQSAFDKACNLLPHAIPIPRMLSASSNDQSDTESV